MERIPVYGLESDCPGPYTFWYLYETASMPMEGHTKCTNWPCTCLVMPYTEEGCIFESSVVATNCSFPALG